MHRFKKQVCSDVQRDGLGIELLSESGEIVAEIFRCDADHTVVLNTFSYDVPLAAIEELIRISKSELEPFEDGSSLVGALVAAPKLSKFAK